MTAHGSSNLLVSLDNLVKSSAHGMTGMSRISSSGLNALLRKQLAKPAGQYGSLLADPVIESAKNWKLAAQTMQDLTPQLLASDLVEALHRAAPKAIARNSQPRSHQLAAWQASLAEHKSVLVTAGTGAGKTECFLIPILQDVLANPRPGGGIQAILLYPLNALIESQRERLSAWAEQLGGKVRFAMYNGDTKETEREADPKSSLVELRSREAIRKRPPEILVTNITMLEYMLLRDADAQLLSKSDGALRWIVLDEAHSYIGSQAAELALLLRRVRAQFGVSSNDVRLMATSATIGGAGDAIAKLRAFGAALAGQDESRVAVVEGQEEERIFPPSGLDQALDMKALETMPAEKAGEYLIQHPRVQQLIQKVVKDGASLTEVAEILFKNPQKRSEAAQMLDRLGTARRQGQPILSWRGHMFHRAQGGLWACVAPQCPLKQEPLQDSDAGWPFGTVLFSGRSRCDCEAPVYELAFCNDCGAIFLQGLLKPGAQPRLISTEEAAADEDVDFDAEPDPEAEADPLQGQRRGHFAYLSAGADIWLQQDGLIYYNQPADSAHCYPYHLLESAKERSCCADATSETLRRFNYGPQFLMRNAINTLIEDLVRPDQRPGLPALGRRALTFSDSRQGVARLSAKMQEDAEHNLVRAHLWHRVQEGEIPDPAEIQKLEAKIKRFEALDDDFEDDLAEVRVKLNELTGASAAPIKWNDLVQSLSEHADVNGPIAALWRNPKRQKVVPFANDDTTDLAQALLYRELLRRPTRQNNPETLGLLRLTFPTLAKLARDQGPPPPLAQAGLTGEDWAAFAHLALDKTFRSYGAVDVPAKLIPFVLPGGERRKKLRSFYSATTEKNQMEENDRRWPTPKSTRSHLVKWVYKLTGGAPEASRDQQHAHEVLTALWELICATATKDVGKGARRLDFSKAAVERLDTAWHCPITRRPYGWSIKGKSPNHPHPAMTEIAYPRLKAANSGGLSVETCAEVKEWLASDPQIQELRRAGHWSDLHDRLAYFTPYMRAQEHSAQVKRPVLKRYEESFEAGLINILNCTTTMEMGVDIADVHLVVNANVPPALSNYRQRAGRAGRRGEPWAFAVTFCRDLPLDRRVFEKPVDFLRKAIAAPKVWFESPALVQRHVNAALLSAWVAERGGQNISSSLGAFLGAGSSVAEAVLPDAPADSFIRALNGNWASGYQDRIIGLVSGTCFAGKSYAELSATTQHMFSERVLAWRQEHLRLLQYAENLTGAAQKRLENQARRMAGEFLLSALAKRGFTPAYGFPNDVVSFINLADNDDDGDEAQQHQDNKGATRPLAQAIREYAPGAEVLIDGLVHKSEGIFLAHGARADTSKLEDLRSLWTCQACSAFGLDRLAPEQCPHCDHPVIHSKGTIRPAGFLSGSTPHLNYHQNTHISANPPRLSAQGAPWHALPQGLGRMRASADGLIVNSVSGQAGAGFAICLDCGRAVPENADEAGVNAALPSAIKQHYSLVPRKKGKSTTQDGLCVGSDRVERIQRRVHLSQDTKTDIWEWQLPPHTPEGLALTLAAAMRDGLADHLGVEAREIGAEVGRSIGPAGERLNSLFLFDQAAGGAGLVTQMNERSALVQALDWAILRLDCPEACERGCPACILSPDLNRNHLTLDRGAALAFAQTMRQHLDLPQNQQIFGPDTRLAGRSADKILSDRLWSGRLQAIDIWLHGPIENWGLGDWPVWKHLLQASLKNTPIRLHLPKSLEQDFRAVPSTLSALAKYNGIAQLYWAQPLPTAGEHHIIMALSTDQGIEGLATKALDDATPEPLWGTAQNDPLLIGPCEGYPMGEPVDFDALQKAASGNAFRRYIFTELDVEAHKFGAAFWALIKETVPVIHKKLEQTGALNIIYSDRYLASPLLLRLLHEVLSKTPGGQAERLIVRTCEVGRQERYPSLVFHDFLDSKDRDAALKALRPECIIELGPKNRIPHPRSLTIELKDKSAIRISLDQGFGPWQVNGISQENIHNFKVYPDAQALALGRAKIKLQNSETQSGTPLDIEQL